MAKSGLIDRGDIAGVAQSLHEENKRIVFTNGVFDILHRGHVEYLQEAKGMGDILIVGLNSDESVRRIKPGRPVNNQEDRAAVLLALRAVDYVVMFREDTPLELIRDVRPDILVKGGDYREEEIVGAEFVKEIGGKVRVIPLREGYSTTEVIRKMAGQKGE